VSGAGGSGAGGSRAGGSRAGGSRAGGSRAGGSGAGGSGAGESTGTVVVAGAANVAIAAAKAVAGLVSGSAAMLSEAVHSLADTLTEVFLFVGLRRGARPADAEHQFGHGRASYLWALLGAFGTLVLGAGFALTHGVQTIIGGEQTGDPLPSYIVLAVSFVMESVSLSRAVRQLRGGATRWRIPVLRYFRRTPDTVVKAVTLEDTAALAGLVFAAVGLAATQLTGSPVWDGAASIAIGLLLAVVAVFLVRANVSLVLGEATPEPLREAIRIELEGLPGVSDVIEVLTMYLGPRSLLVVARVEFAGGANGGPEAAAEEAERRLRSRFPLITHVFLDPTPSER